ncbi:hypothetical protein ABKN59_008794 [Abortiporus biennis]
MILRANLFWESAGYDNVYSKLNLLWPKLCEDVRGSKDISDIHMALFDLGNFVFVGRSDENICSLASDSHLAEVFIYLWLYSRHWVFALQLFLQFEGVAPCHPIPNFFVVIDSSKFAKDAVRRLVTELRYPNADNIEIGCRGTTIQFCSVIIPSIPAHFMVEVQEKIGKIMRSIVVACQATSCTGKQQDFEETETKVMLMFASSALCPIVSLRNDTAIKAKKLISVPEVMITIGKGLITSFMRQKRVFIDSIGMMLPRFTEAISYLMTNRIEYERCLRFKKHTEAIWRTTYDKLRTLTPPRKRLDGVTLYTGNPVISRRAALKLWVSFKDRLKALFGTFEENPDLAVYRQEVSLKRYCNWNRCLCNLASPVHSMHVCKGCWSVYTALQIVKCTIGKKETIKLHLPLRNSTPTPSAGIEWSTDMGSRDGHITLPRDVEKNGSTFVEDVDTNTFDAIYQRHGRIDLNPMPSDSPLDPLNWPSWRKNILLCIVAIHAMQGPFAAALVIPAFMDFAQEFNISLNQASYLVSVQILFLGVFPILWAPLSDRIGRRPVYLISCLVSAGCALAGAFCHSYGTLMTTRIFQAIFISPPQSIGACTVSDTFFSYQKGRKMGVWVLLVTCGPVLAPLIVGYLVQIKGWRTEFYLLASIHLALFFAHLFFGPETLYPNRAPPGEGKEMGIDKHERWYSQYIHFHIYTKTPFRLVELWRPFAMAFRPVVLLSAVAYAITFSYTNVLMTIFVPQIFGEVFHLTPGQIGLQFAALLIGAVLGEQLAGYGSDLLVNIRTRKAGGERLPEYRLPFAYPGFILAIVGLIVWGVQLQNAVPGEWNVTPDVGSAIALFGLQLVTTVCVTYAIECYPADASSVSAFIAFTRQTYGFIAPFYLPIPFENWGDAKAAGLFSALIGLGAFMVVLCHIWGPKWRS